MTKSGGWEGLLRTFARNMAGPAIVLMRTRGVMPRSVCMGGRRGGGERGGGEERKREMERGGEEEGDGEGREATTSREAATY